MCLWCVHLRTAWQPISGAHFEECVITARHQRVEWMRCNQMPSVEIGCEQGQETERTEEQGNT